MSLGKLVDYCVTDESEDEQSSVVSTDGVSFKEMVPDESADYFNLDCSTDDEQFTELKESDLDTLISSYQLSENVVGPHRTVKLLKSHSPPKMSFSTIKRKRLTTAGDDDYLSEKRTATRNTASNSGLTDCFDVKRDQVNAGSFNELFMTPPLITGFSDFRSSTGLPREIRSVLGGHRGCVNTLFWGRSTNNRHLLLSASMDGTIKIWNPLISRSSLWSKGLHNDAAIRCARWCPSSNLIASVGYDKALKIFDVEKGVNL